MRSWRRNLRDIGWSLGATRNEGLGPNSICSAPNLRRAPRRPEAPTTLEARKRFSDQRRPPDQGAIVENFMRGRGSSNEERLRTGRKYRTDRTEGISDGVFASDPRLHRSASHPDGFAHLDVRERPHSTRPRPSIEKPGAASQPRAMREQHTEPRILTTAEEGFSCVHCVSIISDFARPCRTLRPVRR